MEQILLTIAILTTGIIYGTDVFFAIVGKKASHMSDDSSIADLLGHIHLVADKRIPIIGITSVISTSLFIFLIGINPISGKLAGMSLLFLLIHLTFYLRVAKPINKKMSSAAVRKITLHNIRILQNRWDSVILYRAISLTIALLLLVLSITNL